MSFLSFIKQGKSFNLSEPIFFPLIFRISARVLQKVNTVIVLLGRLGLVSRQLPHTYWPSLLLISTSYFLSKPMSMCGLPGDPHDGEYF